VKKQRNGLVVAVLAEGLRWKQPNSGGGSSENEKVLV